MRDIRSWLLCALVAVLPPLALSRPVSAQPEWIGDLRHGGYVIVFRHGATYTDQAKTDPMSNPNKDPMSNPTTGKAGAGERQLNNDGRAQAKSIGEAMHKLAIPVGVVMTSPLQRAVDTGKLLGFGEVSTNPDLAETGAAVAADENKRRADAFRKLVAATPSSSNLVLVTHKPNIMEAFGKDWSDLSEGEASVFKSDGNGAYRLVVRVKADEWSKLAQAAN
ncbi:MAG TPA: histidine phosphatase family protein [Bradyrhizobium sp.]|nr:histidine phosphatase family protein [Bradyrhizobium sp.]